MNKQIFIINGSGGVGKDTFIEILDDIICEEVAWSRTPLIINFSSVDKIKEIARVIGWNGGKTEKDRKFLSDLKLLCTDYNNMPFNSMSEKVNEFLHSNASFIFLHIREPDEIEKAKRAFDAKTILVKRDSVKHITSNMADENVFNYDYDIVINNNGDLKDLANKAKYFLDDCLHDTIKSEY